MSNAICESGVFAKRRDKLRKLLEKQRLDCALIANPANRFYLSGFELHDLQLNESSGMLVICADGEDWLATDSRYALAAEALWQKNRIFIYKGSPAKALGPLLARKGQLIGLEEKSLSHDFVRQLKESAKNPEPSFLPCDGLVEQLRIIKEPCEIAALDQSFSINHKMMDWLAKQIEEGGIADETEKTLAWAIERFFREAGASELAFATIAATGSASALPHANPGDAPIAANAPLLVDAGCRAANYCSDQTRTWWLGKNPAPEFARTMKLVRQAQNRAIEIIRPGVSCADVYKAAYDVFAKAGVENHFTHSLGHGVGLETHEGPSLSPRSAGHLEKNMVVTVEPGLYYPEWGGIRWEYTVIVEENGARIL